MKNKNEFSRDAHMRGPCDASHAHEHAVAHRHGPRGADLQREVAHGEGIPRAGIFAKTPLDYEQNNPHTMLLFLETAPMQKDPYTLSSLQQHGPWPPPHASTRRAVALVTAPATRDPC